MKKETKIKRTRWPSEVVDDFIKNSILAKIGRIVLIILISFIFIIMIVNKMGGLKEIYNYPEEEYEHLVEEVEKVVVDDLYIDMERISDKEIKYTTTYTKPANEAEWTSCKINLNKSNAKVTAIVTKSINNTLKMEVYYMPEKASNILNIIATIIFIVIMVVLSTFLVKGALFTIWFLIVILIDIPILIFKGFKVSDKKENH